MVMTIKAIVDQADYENMVRTYYFKDDIDAEWKVYGAQYKKGRIAFGGSSSLNFSKKRFKAKTILWSKR